MIFAKEVVGITAEDGYARLSVETYDSGFMVRCDSAGAGSSYISLTREQMNTFLWKTLQAVNASYEVKP